MSYQPDQVLVSDDANSLFTDCAKNIIAYANECVRKRGSCHIVLAGGSTPERLYLALSSSPLTGQMPWPSCQFYFGDERMVAHDHADSNYAMARRALFDRAPVPKANIHPIPTDCTQASDCAAAYETLLSAVPSLDLVLLGIGQDGHTASLFPDTDILDETQKNVSAVYVNKLHAWRISLTYAFINRAKRVMILVQGADKAAIVQQIFNGEQQHLYPVTAIRPQGELIWNLDQEAMPGD